MENINGVEHVTDYTYDYENRVTAVETNGISRNYYYDSYGRLCEVEDTYASGQQPLITYNYHDTAERLSTQVASMDINFENGLLLYSYTYDGNGNVLSVYDVLYTTHYVYDTANQLIRENNQEAHKTWTWTYDNAGNILTKSEYAYTTGELGTPVNTVHYTYGDDSWGDLLTAYNGVARTYDEIGNLLTDGTWTYTWHNGRELASMSKGSTTWNYTYDANGMRTQRSNGTTVYNYVYNGSQLAQMTVGSNTLNFAYDASGMPMMVTYNGTNYYYIVNLQGDVKGIVDSTGTLVVYYTYDAWGKRIHISDSMARTLGVLNPLRYRGYVYDQETEYYYLQSRYYDPKIGRFINADGLVATGQGMLGNNMFAYCRNNPVRRRDVSGTTDAEIFDDDSNLLDDDKLIHGGTVSNGGTGGNSSLSGGTGGNSSLSGGSGISEYSSISGYSGRNFVSVPGNEGKSFTSPGDKSGQFTFKSEAALNKHYEKHNPEFGNVFSTPPEYVETANYVIENGQYIAKQNAYVKFYGMNGRANYAFVGMSYDGAYITTFHLKHVNQILF